MIRIYDYYYTGIENLNGDVIEYRIFKFIRFMHTPTTALSHVMEKLDMEYGKDNYAITDFKRI